MPGIHASIHNRMRSLLKRHADSYNIVLPPTGTWEQGMNLIYFLGDQTVTIPFSVLQRVSYNTLRGFASDLSHRWLDGGFRVE